MKREGGRVRVRIGELVLEGFAPGDRFAIAEGLRRELARLIREQGVGMPAGRTAAADAGEFAMPAGGSGEATGRAAAQSVHRRMTAGKAKR
jgi:hypothetical protein